MRKLYLTALALAALIVLAAGLSLRNSSSSTDVYTYVYTVDGTPIPIYYSEPELKGFLTERMSHYTSVVAPLGATIEVGSKSVVGDPEWVDVVNEEPLDQTYSNTVSELARGDSCLIELGGSLTVVKVFDRRINPGLLVEYTAPGDPSGTPCPSGALFVTTPEQFRSNFDRYAEITENMVQDKLLVEALLAEEYRGETTSVEYAGWAKVVNFKPLKQEFANGFSYLMYGDNCSLAKGTIQVRGQAGSRTLYEYTAEGEPMGTPCPSGILFFG